MQATVTPQYCLNFMRIAINVANSSYVCSGQFKLYHVLEAVDATGWYVHDCASPLHRPHAGCPWPRVVSCRQRRGTDGAVGFCCPCLRNVPRTANTLTFTQASSIPSLGSITFIDTSAASPGVPGGFQSGNGTYVHTVSLVHGTRAM